MTEEREQEQPSAEEAARRAEAMQALEGEVMPTTLTRQPASSADLQREAQELATVFRWGKLMDASGFFPDTRSAAQAAVKILAGRELGFSAIASMTGIYILDGKPTLGAGLMAQALKRSGKYDYRVREHTSSVCRIEVFQRSGNAWESIGVSEFTEEDALQAELGKRGRSGAPSTWEKYPRNMLFARAMSNAIAFYAPDVFDTRVYTPEEIRPDLEYDEQLNPVDVAAHMPAPRGDFEQQERPAPAQQQRQQPRQEQRQAPPAQQQAQAPRRDPSAPLELADVVDVRTLQTWQWQRYKGQAADVCRFLGVEAVGDIAGKFTTPEQYREAAVMLMAGFDPDGYAAYLEATTPIEGVVLTEQEIADDEQAKADAAVADAQRDALELDLEAEPAQPEATESAPGADSDAQPPAAAQPATEPAPARVTKLGK